MTGRLSHMHLLLKLIILSLLSAVVLIVSSCHGDIEVSKVKEFDITKAVKLVPGENIVGRCPDGYLLVSFTYNNDEITDQSPAPVKGFTISASNPANPEAWRFEDKSINSKSATASDTIEPDKNCLEQRFLRYSCTYSTDNYNIAYYIQESLPEDYEELAEYMAEYINSFNIGEVIDTEAKIFTNSPHCGSSYLDCDRNGKLNILFTMIEDDESTLGFVDLSDQLYRNTDCFYFNLKAAMQLLDTRIHPEGTLERCAVDAVAHEYAHIIENVYIKYYYWPLFLSEGFVNAMVAITNNFQYWFELPAEMHNELLFDDTYKKKPGDFSFSLNYAVAGRFLYWLYMTYPLEGDTYPYQKTVWAIMEGDGIDEICDTLAHKSFEVLYREFFLSVLAGSGIYFGPDVKAFAESERIHMDRKGITEAIWNMYYHQDEYNPYRYTDKPLVVDGIPGGSFVFAEWEDNPTTFYYQPQDDSLETWVFAAKS